MKEGAIDSTELNKIVEAEAVRQRDYLVALGYNADLPSQGVRMTEADVKTSKEAFEAESKKISESLADIFVGEKRANDPLREKARLALINGRAA